MGSRRILPDFVVYPKHLYYIKINIINTNDYITIIHIKKFPLNVIEISCVNSICTIQPPPKGGNHYISYIIMRATPKSSFIFKSEPQWGQENIST